MNQQTSENEDFCLNMITTANAARRGYLSAIQLAKKGRIKEALATISASDTDFDKAHDMHMQLLQKEADNEGTGLDLLLIHAEDIMMNAEIIKVLALELSELYAKLLDKSLDFDNEENSLQMLCRNVQREGQKNSARAQIQPAEDKKTDSLS